MVFIAPPADSTPQPGLLALSRAAFHGGIGGKCPGNRSLGAPNKNNIKNDKNMSAFLATLGEGVLADWPMVRTKHFTACMRIPSHCYTKQQDSHLRAVLSGSFKVRLGAHGRFHPASGQVHVVPTAAWDLNCLPSACCWRIFPTLSCACLSFQAVCRNPATSGMIPWQDYAVKSPLSDGILTCFQLRFISAFLYPFSGR